MKKRELNDRMKQLDFEKKRKKKKGVESKIVIIFIVSVLLIK